jgi:hypothetical protein
VFEWRFLDRSGSNAGTSESLVDRGAAEAWLTDRWTELSLRGISAVELIDAVTGEVLYRMSLAEE